MRAFIKIENTANFSQEALTSPHLVGRKATDQLFLAKGGKVESSTRMKPEQKIKKIPLELRRRRIKFSSERVWYKRFWWQLRQDAQFQRWTVQFAFVLLCVWIGIEFYLFMKWGLSGGREPFIPRPSRR